MPASDADATAPDGAAEHRRKLIALALMGLGMFMAVLDIQIVSASLPQIQAGLSASADEVVWVQTAYLIAETIMIPLSSFLSRALSLRWSFVLSAAAFTVASLLCASASTIEELIFWRSVQGFVGGVMVPSVYVAIFMIFPPAKLPKGMAMLALIVTLAPTIGPSFGGWVTETFSWHWLFLINLLPGIVITVGMSIYGKLDEPERGLLGRIDLFGLLMMALFLGGSSFVLEEGARNDWFADESIRLWSAISVIGAVGFIWRVFTAPEPIVRLHAYRNVDYLAGTVMTVIAGFALFGLIYLYPLYLARIGHLSSAQIGTILMVTGFAMVAMGPVIGILNARLDGRVVLFIGFVMLALSSWMTAHIDTQWRYDELFIPQLLRGGGLMLVFSSVMATSFVTLPPDQIKDASALLSLLRNMGGALGIALLNTLMLIRFNFHWGRIAESVNPAREVIAERMGMLREMSDAMGMPDPDQAATRMMGATVAEQAMTMSFADCFVLMTVLLVIAAIIPFFLAKPPSLGAKFDGGH